MGDTHRVTPAMLIAATLALTARWDALPERMRWQLGAYTNWNLTLLLARHIIGIPEWDPFLCINSMAIFVGFRTGFAHGLDDNIRRKLNRMDGTFITRRLFVLGDLLCHFLPAAMTTAAVVRRGQRIPFVTITHALTLASWFAFCRVGKLDPSDIYVPHPWKRAWLAIIISMLATRESVNSFVDRRYWTSLTWIVAMALPYIGARRDPADSIKYHYEFVAPARQLGRSQSEVFALPSSQTLPRNEKSDS